MASSPETRAEPSALDILQIFATNLALQREAIDQRNWAGLAEVVPKLQHAMGLVQSYPGGPAGLRANLTSIASTSGSCIADLLERASSDRMAAAELIRVNVNRLNALKSLLEHGAFDNSESGQFTTGSPGVLLSKRV